jgi:hypothetical protein
MRDITEALKRALSQGHASPLPHVSDVPLPSSISLPPHSHLFSLSFASKSHNLPITSPYPSLFPSFPLQPLSNRSWNGHETARAEGKTTAGRKEKEAETRIRRQEDREIGRENMYWSEGERDVAELRTIR